MSDDPSHLAAGFNLDRLNEIAAALSRVDMAPLVTLRPDIPARCAANDAVRSIQSWSFLGGK